VPVGGQAGVGGDDRHDLAEVVLEIDRFIAALVGVIGGVLLAPRMALLDTNMSYLGLKAFPAAILGGFGSIPGAVAGGIILGVIETVSMGTLSFHFSWIKEINDIIVWIVLIVVLMVRPDGLFGRAKVKRV